MTEEMSVFKSYLRRLLHDLKTIRTAFESDDKETAMHILNTLIDDTQKGIEDN